MNIALIILGIALLATLFFINSIYRKNEISQCRLSEYESENLVLKERMRSGEMERDRIAGECESAKSRLTDENTRLNSQLAEAVAENKVLMERIRMAEIEQDRLQKENELRFKNLSNEILTQQTNMFRTQQETRLQEILGPLKQNLETFHKSISENFSLEAKERVALGVRIDELRQLQQSIGKEARELTTALKGNSKIQGDWGEMILESILERSGLERDVHYQVQMTRQEGQTITNEEGSNLRPDVVINYPDGKKVIIDSKVSLTAFVRLVNADNREEECAARDEHLRSVRKHIKELAGKRYQDYIGDTGKADFVMMFIPNEPAYIAAMQADNDLWQYAFDRRVIILSPTHLLTTLSLVAQMWRQDKITRNIIDIATESGKMYDKFVAFVEDLQKIDKALNSAHDAYAKALNKLSTGTGNLITRAEKLKGMGAKASKNLPPLLRQGDEEVAS
ncbi:MAG: DNA recombination protein RmuC [Muribaculaceae bacterium]|nr:DNA recombination protein RmuC [Muribaculaceae bacterium]